MTQSTAVQGGHHAGVEAEYRARAGALTLMYLNSGLDRDTLRAVLVQAATDTQLVDPDELNEPKDRIERINEVFADRFLLEPADPNDDPDDPETQMQPTPAGREVPLVGAVLQHWLDRCPAGPIQLGGDSGFALWPLLAGWASTVIHAFATGPRTADEVWEEIGVLDAEAVATRIELLEGAQMLRALPPEEGEEETRFEPTDWLRLAVAPLAVAARMELRHPLGDTAPIAAADVEAALRLTLPLLPAKSNLSGTCSLEVELDEGVIGSPVGMTVTFEEGRVTACVPGIDPEADASLTGATAAWLDAVIDDDRSAVRSDGDWRFPRDLLGGLHKALFR